MSQRVTPHLWYSKHAEEAAQLYAKIFPDSRVERVTPLPAASPAGPAGSVKMVEFTVLGQGFFAITAGPHDEFNDAISFLVNCDDQGEIDRYWNALVEHGGKAVACGWVIDRYGVRWQISPRPLHEWMTDEDPEKVRRVAEEMLRHTKFDLAKLEAAYKGT
ncbi:MAG: VOC family protein [Deltaproteobacteria bacterium]|nr:VOC family protein [Deltaproteobacteria bacterium]MCW5802841.1 VOC family protein [Deltaproteobacteria bacterium]